jgi:hypothetical protein
MQRERIPRHELALRIDVLADISHDRGYIVNPLILRDRHARREA